MLGQEIVPVARKSTQSGGLLLIAGLHLDYLATMLNKTLKPIEVILDDNPG